jgi:hypothetical protein
LPLNIPEVIDFRIPTAWLARCEKVHGAQCDQRNLPKRYSNPIDIILVDVIDKCLVMKTTASRYFALSYVWGGPITTTTTNQNFSVLQQAGSLGDTATLPETVSDAMLLARELGERYLWVDCLSIIQDSTSKHQDIAHMDIIFAKAELTIVATCGNNATAGLTGVRPGTRRRRTMSKQQGSHLMSLYLPASKYGLLNRTAYASRGWTLQELLLSKRVLFVSQQQIVFHCTSSRRSESLPGERPHHTQYGFGEIDLFPKAISGPNDFCNVLSYNTMVQEYSMRRLSFQSDIENAFAGLASILEEWYSGTPVVHGMMLPFFACSMTWMFSGGRHDCSNWTKNERGKKREGFPTWSWVAWAASITHINERTLSISLPVLSLVRNIEIVMFSERKPSCSWEVTDKSSTENHVAPSGQPIRVNRYLTSPEALHLHPSTLGFDAERTLWRNFSGECADGSHYLLNFGFSGISQFCGYLSVSPDPEVSTEALNHCTGTLHDSDSDWSLVRLYQLRLTPWDGIHGHLEIMLSKLRDHEHLESASAFRRRLEQSELLFVLLIRRHGIHWERVGAGFMFEKDWPSTKSRTSRRSYQERIVLI